MKQPQHLDMNTNLATTGAIAPAGTTASALSWPAHNPEFLTAIPWLDEAARSLRQDFGLTRAASFLVPLTALGAAGGPSVRVATTEGLSVAPTVNIVWVDRPGSRVRDALHLSSSPALALCEGMRIQRMMRTADDINAEASALLKAQRGGDWCGREGTPAPMELLYALTTGRGRPSRTKPDADATVKTLVALAYLLRPDLITEDPDPRALLKPQDLSADGAVVSMNFDGLAWAQLRNAPRRVQADFAALAMRAWRPQFRSPSQQSPEASATCLWLVERSDLDRLFGDAAIRASGIPRAFLFAEAAWADPTRLPGGVLPERAYEGLCGSTASCWKFRTAGSHAIVFPDDQAGELARSYVSARCRQLARFGDAAEGVPACLSTLLHKNALLAHLALHQGSANAHDKKMGADTMRAAISITDAVMASHLDIVTTHAGRNAVCLQDGNGIQIELVAARLRAKGPLSVRDLARSFHRCKTDDIRSLLAAAVEAGAVQQHGEKFMLAGNG